MLNISQDAILLNIKVQSWHRKCWVEMEMDGWFHKGTDDDEKGGV
jgi:hypothetical protein